MSFLLHATDGSGLQAIVEKHALLAHPPKPRMLQTSGCIFFQWLHKDTMMRRRRARFWGPYLLVFRDTVLKGHHGTLGPIGSFDDPSMHTRFRGLLTSSHKRTLASLVKASQGGVYGNTSFMHSHEICVQQDVPLDGLLAIVSTVPRLPFPSSVFGSIPVVYAENMTYLQLYRALCDMS